MLLKIQTYQFSEAQVEAYIAEGLDNSRFLEIIVPNDPGNVGLQAILYNLGVMPLGVFPGGNMYTDSYSQHIETTIHFGIARPDIVNQMVEIDFARDYRRSPIKNVSHNLREEWRELA